MNYDSAGMVQWNLEFGHQCSGARDAGTPDGLGQFNDLDSWNIADVSQMSWKQMQGNIREKGNK